MEAPFQAAKQYLRAAFGLEWDLRAFDAASLPTYLRARYEFRAVKTVSGPVLLMAARGDEALRPLQLLKDAERIEQLSAQVAIVVARSLPPYARKRLVEHRRGFVIPHAHAYLPSMLLASTAHPSPSPAPAVTRMSPATQAVFLRLLYARSRVTEAVTHAPQRMAYSPMTMSRAIAELEALGLVRSELSGREKQARFEAPWEEIWTQALPYLRTPVRKRIPVAEAELVGHGSLQLAGISALARFSDLSEPRIPVYALHVPFSIAKNPPRRMPQAIEDEDEAAAVVELWSYAPLRETAPLPTVDRLSLYLSLREETDVRVQAALKHMQEEIFRA